MSHLRTRYLAPAFLLLATGCGPGIFVPAGGSGGTITASPSSVTITGIGSTASVTLAEANASNPTYAVTSGCVSSILTTMISGSALTITAVSGGSCTLTVGESGSHSVTIPIVITTTAVTGS